MKENQLLPLQWPFFPISIMGGFTCHELEWELAQEELIQQHTASWANAVPSYAMFTWSQRVQNCKHCIPEIHCGYGAKLSTDDLNILFSFF